MFLALVSQTFALGAPSTAQPVTPSTTPIASPAPTPTALPSPSPSSTPQPVPTPSIVPTPIPTASPLVLPPDAPPQIIDVHLSEQAINSGDTVSGYVVTSTNVASVEVRISSFGFGVPRTDFGHFEISYQVPHIPFFARGNYTAQIIARNTAGVSATREIPVSLR
ncbi:MAG: hypothetical protein M3Y21_00910 [Candidatus Eremiobacteraeota bacterium]|nr:hypothetical protein [Candidatus Eremiobacteraeota bacterium]